MDGATSKHDTVALFRARLTQLLRSDEICEFEFRDATTTEKSDHLRHSEYQIPHIRDGATDLETNPPIQILLNLAHGTDI